MRYWTVVIHLVVTERTTTRRFSRSSECLECCSRLHAGPQQVQGTWIPGTSSFGQLLVQESEGLTHEGETQILSLSLFDTGEGA